MKLSEIVSGKAVGFINIYITKELVSNFIEASIKLKIITKVSYSKNFETISAHTKNTDVIL
jgi:hypothetical protein